MIGIAGASGAAMLFAVIPSVSALFAFLMLGEALHPGVLAGLVLAVGVYLAAMTAMQFFGDDTTSELPEALPALVG